MKKSIEQKFIDFKKRHKLSNAIITKMITEYANSDLEFARTYFSEQYGISIHVFYKARDYAVIFGLIGNETCKNLRIKTAENYKNNNEKSTPRASLNHFYKLTEERQKYFDSFSENEIRDMGSKYVAGVSVNKIAIAYDTGEYTVKYLLSKGVVELIFDGTTVKKMVNMLGPKINGILKKRETNKRELLNCLLLEIKFLTQQIKCYKAYIKFSGNPLSKEDVEKRLSDVMEMYNKALQL